MTALYWKTPTRSAGVLFAGDKLPFDLYKEVLLNYLKILPRLNMQDIQDYAMAVPKQKMIMEALQMEVL